jgi:DNA invertase Pin-like site-specific DNA recombinase
MNTKHSSKKQHKLRYIAYVRKSSESKEKQELSHISQITNIERDFGHLNIVRWMEAESKSAFTPGRSIFNEMVEAIKNDEADGIVAWHPNRLSRNEMDSAEITYLLRGKLKDLKFCSYTFINSPEGIMMLQMTMNQSQYESTKQGKDVVRGLETKAESGEKPGRVPPGYQKIPILDENGQYILHKKEKKIKTDTKQR